MRDDQFYIDCMKDALLIESKAEALAEQLNNLIVEAFDKNVNIDLKIKHGGFAHLNMVDCSISVNVRRSKLWSGIKTTEG